MRKQFNERRFLKFLVLAPLFIALVGFVVMSLWNTVLVPAVAGVSIIGFWQAIGLTILGKILFGGRFGGPGGWRGRGPWAHNMKEKWAQMNPEEREKFKQQMRTRCKPGASRESEVASREFGGSSTEP